VTDGDFLSLKSCFLPSKILKRENQQYIDLIFLDNKLQISSYSICGMERIFENHNLKTLTIKWCVVFESGKLKKKKLLQIFAFSDFLDKKIHAPLPL
jgi:hypothetical protein